MKTIDLTQSQNDWKRLITIWDFLNIVDTIKNKNEFLEKANQLENNQSLIINNCSFEISIGATKQIVYSGDIIAKLNNELVHIPSMNRGVYQPSFNGTEINWVWVPYSEDSTYNNIQTTLETTQTSNSAYFLKVDNWQKGDTKYIIPITNGQTNLTPIVKVFRDGEEIYSDNISINLTTAEVTTTETQKVESCTAIDGGGYKIKYSITTIELINGEEQRKTIHFITQEENEPQTIGQTKTTTEKADTQVYTLTHSLNCDLTLVVK